jgi:hypothetical protein
MRTMGLMELWKYGVRSFLQKSGTILYFPFIVDLFVIGFAIVEIPSVVISKKKNFSIYTVVYVDVVTLLEVLLDKPEAPFILAGLVLRVKDNDSF